MIDRDVDDKDHTSKSPTDIKSDALNVGDVVADMVEWCKGLVWDALSEHTYSASCSAKAPQKPKPIAC